MLTLTQLSGFGAMAEPSGPPDVTPDPIDIANINESGGTGFVAFSVSAAITGINQTVSLRAVISAVSGSASASLRQYRNGAQVDNVAVAGGADTEATYVNGSTLSFAVVTTGAAGAIKNFTITISNQTDGGAVLDAFTSTTLIDL